MMKKKLLINERVATWGKYFILMMLIIFAYCAQAQTIPITGTVIDASTKDPIPGASVFVKGNAKNGTVTNIDGKFTLSVTDQDETLVISFVGFKTVETQIQGKKEFSIDLEPDSQSIDELVVTALGIKREKKALGYSVGEVKTDAIVNSSETNVITALSGKVSGVIINSTSSSL